MNVVRNPDQGITELPSGVTERPSSRLDERVLRQQDVRAERNRYVERAERRSKWTWKKIAALAIGAYALYHFRYWMREKLHLAFSKVPQNEIEGNMSTTAVIGGATRSVPGNAEGRGTTTGGYGF
jgi:hypothetical protein